MIAGEAEPDMDVVLSMQNSTNTAEARTLKETVMQAYPLTGYSGGGIALSPDGERLAFNAYLNGSWSPVVMNLATAQSAVFSGERGYPEWSPDGQKIAWLNLDTESIEVMDPESGVFAVLTDGFYQEWYPKWSPDGSKIAFETDRGGSWNIWVKDTASGELKQLSAGSGAYPSWSPDGGKIAFWSSGELRVLEMETGSETVLGQYDPCDIDWSPEGSFISFVSSSDGQGHLVRADGSGVARISATGDSPVSVARWLASGNSLIYHDGRSLYQYSLKDGKTELLAQNGMISELFMSKSGLFGYGDPFDHQSILYQIKGRFEVRGVPLSTGPNIVQATATDASGTAGLPSEGITVVFDRDSLPDLEVAGDDVFIYPAYPLEGQDALVNLVVWNRGDSALRDVSADVYLWDSLGNITLIKSVTIPFLDRESGEVIGVSVDTAGKAGSNTLIAVVDPRNVLAERDEDNNLAMKEIFIATHEGVTMTTTTDSLQYLVNQDVKITVDLRNAGADRTGTLETVIKDSSGLITASLDPVTVVMPYASQNISTLFWNTGVSYAGAYRVETVLKDGAETDRKSVV